MKPWPKVAAGMVATGAAAALIVNFEGTVHRGYLDTGGVVTACVGHTRTAQLHRIYTPDECQRLLAEDIARAEAEVQRQLRREVPQPVYDALVSFTFNVGEGNLSKSTLLRKINAGDIRGGCDELLRWVYDNGQRLRGLERRRQAERQLCLEGT